MLYYIQDKDNKIILFDKDRTKLENTLNMMPQYSDLEIKETEREIVNFEFTDTEAYREKIQKQNRDNIDMLHITRLDFINCLEKLGLTWQNVKTLFSQYPNVEKELTMCSNVYRGNPLINQMIPLVNNSFGLNITPEQVDEEFIEKTGYERLT